MQQGRPGLFKGTGGYWRAMATRRQHRIDTLERQLAKARAEREHLLAIASRADSEGIIIMPEDVGATTSLDVPPAA